MPFTEDQFFDLFARYNQAIWPMQDRVVWGEGRALTGYGHYHERYVRTAEGWRIAAQKLTRLVMEFDG